jgi:DNA-binding XRE family transcriptional regulator
MSINYFRRVTHQNQASLIACSIRYSFIGDHKFRLNMKEENEGNIGKRIRKLRHLHGYNQGIIASEIGLSQTAYSKIETGDTNLTIGRATAIDRFFGMSLTDLLTWEDNIIK